MNADFFYRTEILLGKTCLNLIQSQKVIIFGVGGVGSWCAESLVRSGVRDITLVDFDTICSTNINRQAHATSSTIGKHKTEIMKQRLIDINPHVSVSVISRTYTAKTSHSFNLNTYTVIVDAIDSFYDKMHLIQQATQTQAFFISSMGAARKCDPQHIQFGNFWDIQYCLLARKLRKKLRKEQPLPRSFPCVYSTEQNKTGQALVHESDTTKRVNGSIAHITALFGFYIAGEIIQHIKSQIEE
ncbi:MAG: tRNA threonylcarbamoyladenosine dehydratase [Bacteroidales bacterium]